MPSVNRVTLIGNLTRDPQIKHLANNTTVTEFGLAMNRRFKTATGEERDEVCYVDCSAFGRQADVLHEYCRKGKPLYIEGRLKFDQWEDKQGFGKRSKISVVVEHFQFLGSRAEDGADPAGAQARPESTGDAEPTGERGTWRKEERLFPERRRKRGAVEKPFDETVKFKEADIPF